jgi:uncharacterized RDD family membrane protein YckC
MPTATPIFAPPAKRLVAATIDIAIVTCVGWFGANLLSGEWYPYAYLAWCLPLSYWIYETICLNWLEGGSLGRRLFDIQVVSASGDPGLAFWQTVLRPGVRVAAFASLVLLFSPTWERMLDLAAFPYLIEMALLFTPVSITAADVVAGTRVVNTPPPQPHRAPAGPMYSATDAEFGRPPRRHK